MFLDVQVININSIKSGTSKDRGWIWCPHGINNDHSHIKKHHLWRWVSSIPNSYSPIGGCWNKSIRMIVVPSDLVDSQQMSFISFLILAWISQRAFMNFTFFSSHQEWKSIEFVEIKTKTTCQSNKVSFLLFLAC